MLQSLLVLGTQLFHHVYFFYKPLYSLYKTVLDHGERTILRRIVRPGMIVVDIGANIGVFSRFLAGLVGVDGKVNAFSLHRTILIDCGITWPLCRRLKQYTRRWEAAREISFCLNRVS